MLKLVHNEHILAVKVKGNKQPILIRNYLKKEITRLKISVSSKQRALTPFDDAQLRVRKVGIKRGFPLSVLNIFKSKIAARDFLNLTHNSHKAFEIILENHQRMQFAIWCQGKKNICLLFYF